MQDPWIVSRSTKLQLSQSISLDPTSRKNSDFDVIDSVPVWIRNHPQLSRFFQIIARLLAESSIRIPSNKFAPKSPRFQVPVMILASHEIAMAPSFAKLLHNESVRTVGKSWNNWKASISIEPLS